MKTPLLHLAAAVASSPLAVASPALSVHHTSVPVQEAKSSESVALSQIFAEERDFRRRELGERSADSNSRRNFLPQVDPASQERRRKAWTDFRRRLASVDRSKLTADQRIDAAVFEVVLDGLIAEQEARAWEMPFNSDTSFWSNLDSGDGLRTAEDHEDYLARLRQMPRFFDQHVANMRAGLSRGFSVPAVTLRGRDASIEGFITRSPQSNPLYKPFLRIPDSVAPATKARLATEAASVISSTVVPAYVKLLKFMREEYVPRSRKTISAADLPNGAAYYRAQAKLYTTLDLPPEEIHQIGLREVERIAAEMDAVKRKLGFAGTTAELAESLKGDPRFTAQSPEELLWRTAYITKQVDGRIGGLIGTLPRQRFAVRPVPPEIAPFYTSGRGGREACWMNTYDLPSRPLYALTALTLHECAPGHSLQTAIAAEQQQRPDFRRNAYFSGYSEGWGLYSEWLGVAMGLYETPYDDFGRLSYAMWRACRLVIDTGIHRYGWSREKAVAYLRERTALSDHEIETEIDRYISWPGQALSYKLGELKIRELRERAERKLGARFDERRFHDAILGLGSVPLSVLESEMTEWLNRNSAARSPASE